MLRVFELEKLKKSTGHINYKYAKPLEICDTEQRTKKSQSELADVSKRVFYVRLENLYKSKTSARIFTTRRK